VKQQEEVYETPLAQKRVDARHAAQLYTPSRVSRACATPVTVSDVKACSHEQSGGEHIVKVAGVAKIQGRKVPFTCTIRLCVVNLPGGGKGWHVQGDSVCPELVRTAKSIRASISAQVSERNFVFGV
jgi:hypothetical protein